MSELVRGAETRALLSPPGQSQTPLSDVRTGSTNLRWLWRAFTKRKYLVAGIMLCLAVPALTYVNVAEPVYRATASIQIDPESTKVLPYPDVADSTHTVSGYYELYIKTQDEILKSEGLRLRTAARVKQLMPAASPGQIDAAMSRSPAVERVPGSLMLRISYTAGDARLAATIANAWAEEFVVLHREKRYETSKAAAEFLRSQIANLEEKLRQAEGQLVQYAQQHSLLNMDSGEANVVRQRFDYLSKELSRSEKEFMAIKAQYDEMAIADRKNLLSKTTNPVILSLEAKVYDSEQELSQLLSRFGENWPSVKEKKSQVALLTRQLDQARQAEIGGTLAQVAMKYQAAQAEYRMLKNAVAAQALVVNRLNQDSLDYNSRKREVQASEQLYQGLLQRLKETGVSAGTAFSNVRVALPAQIPQEPYRPRKGLTIALALALGLTLSVGLCVLLESFDNAVADPGEVEQLGVALLGWVPRIEVEKSSRAGSRLTLLSPAGSNHNLLPGTAVRTRRQENQSGVARECVRTLCSSIVLSRSGGPPQTILVSSAAPQEGKSTIAASLGIAFAEMGLSTLLIDGDLRRPTLSARFGIETAEGLSTYLAGGALALHETEIANLTLLPSGRVPPNSLALLNSDRMTDLLKLLSGRFRFIVIDGSPLLSVADATVLSAKVSGVVVVVKAGQTPRDTVKRTLQHLRQTGAAVLGVALNQVDLKHPSYAAYTSYYYPEASSEGARAGSASVA